jgi:hypothetical protein
VLWIWHTLGGGVATASLVATTADITITVIGGTTAVLVHLQTFTSTGIDDNATSTAITIDSSENVGIGTASPTTLLDLNKAQASETVLRVGNTSTSAGSGSKITAEGSSNKSIDVGIRSINDSAYGALDAESGYVWYDGATSLVLGATDSAGIIKFNTGGIAERMRINSSGNVSIGSSFASGVATRVLTVDDPSNAAIVVAYNGATALNLYADADEANIGSYLQGANMKFFTTPSGGSTTERMRITNAGYTKMSPNGTYVSTASSYHEMYQNYAGITSYIYNNSATGDGLLLNGNII